MYPYIEIFNKSISTYHFLIFVGMIMMYLFNIIIFKNVFKALLISIIVNVFAVLGAYLLFHIESPKAPLTSFGLSFFGTVYFLPLGMLIFNISKSHDKHFFRDQWSIAVPLELCIVRFGCYLAGCCLGVEANHGVHFPGDAEGVYRIPIQLYECVWDILLFALLIVIHKKYNKRGIIYPMFMVSYGFIRFILEFWRDTAKHFYGLSNGQIFAFISVIIGCIWIMFLYRKKENVR